MKTLLLSFCLLLASSICEANQQVRKNYFSSQFPTCYELYIDNIFVAIECDDKLEEAAIMRQIHSYMNIQYYGQD